MTEKTEKIEPKQAAEGMTLVALCKQCGEIRRPKFRSDARSKV